MFGVAGVIPGAGSGPRVAVKGISYGTGAALRGAPARGNCSTWHGSPGTGGPGEQVPGPAGPLLTVTACPCCVGPVTGWPLRTPSVPVVNLAFRLREQVIPSVVTDVVVLPSTVMSRPPLCAGVRLMVALSCPKDTLVGSASRPATYTLGVATTM